MTATELQELLANQVRKAIEPHLPKIDGVVFEMTFTPSVIGGGQYGKGNGILYLACLSLRGKTPAKPLLIEWPIGLQINDKPVFRINNKFYKTVEEMAADIPRIVGAKLKALNKPPIDLNKIVKERDELAAKLLTDGNWKVEISERNKHWTKDVIHVVQIKNTNIYVLFREINLQLGDNEAKCICFGHTNGGRFRPTAFVQRLKKTLMEDKIREVDHLDHPEPF